MMRPSSDNWKEYRVHRPWSSLGTLAIPASTRGTTQHDTSNPNSFRKCIDDHLLTQVIKQPKRAHAPPDPILTEKEELVRDVKARGSLGCSDHRMVEFRIPR